MTTIKGPAIFLAQFAGDAAPFNSFKSIAAWAAKLGYKGVQIPSWDARLFDLKRAAESKAYCDEIRALWQVADWRLRSFRRICRDSWWPCIPRMTWRSTDLRRRRCEAIRKRGKRGRWNNYCSRRRRRPIWGLRRT